MASMSVFFRIGLIACVAVLVIAALLGRTLLLFKPARFDQSL